MCGSVVNEYGAMNLVEEYLRWSRGNGGYLDLAKDLLRSAQNNRGWLLDYEIVGTTLVKKAPKPITGDPGVAAIERALEEIVKTKPDAKTAPKRVKRVVRDRRVPKHTNEMA